MVLSEKTLYSLGRRCVYIFKRRKAKKEIPDKSWNPYLKASPRGQTASPLTVTFARPSLPSLLS